jgi:hypothetical protein
MERRPLALGPADALHASSTSRDRARDSLSALPAAPVRSGNPSDAPRLHRLRTAVHGSAGGPHRAGGHNRTRVAQRATAGGREQTPVIRRRTSGDPFASTEIVLRDADVVALAIARACWRPTCAGGRAAAPGSAARTALTPSSPTCRRRSTTRACSGRCWSGTRWAPTSSPGWPPLTRSASPASC